MAVSCLEESDPLVSADSISSGDPGAAPFGNFPHYYRFHPPGDRLQLLSPELKTRLPEAEWSRPLLCLDVGCNSGDLSVALYRLLMGFQDNETAPALSVDDLRHVQLLCCDIDATLIQKAKETNPFPDSISYSCLNIMDAVARQEVFDSFLARFDRSSFDLGFCMSVTMWIHLHHGDRGLVEFLVCLVSLCKYLLIEPQPWKCYRSAARRLRKLGRNDFDHFRSLTITGDMTKQITDILTNDGAAELICSFGNTSWDRSILLFKSNKQ